MRKKVQVGGDHRLFACLVCHFHRGQTRQILIEMEISWDLQVLGRFFLDEGQKAGSSVEGKNQPLRKKYASLPTKQGFCERFFCNQLYCKSHLGNLTF